LSRGLTICGTIISKEIKSEINVNSEHISGVTGIVLAGGKSLRLGREKALERVGGKRLIEKAVDSLCPISQEVLVVTSQEQFNNIASINLAARVVVDLCPNKASFGGIYTGLSSSNTLYCIVVACDMPFLNSALLRYLTDLAPGFDVVIPRFNGNIEALHAVYSRTCLHAIRQLLDKNMLQIIQLLPLVRTRYVDDDEINRYDPKHLSFFNINTRSDLLQAEEIIGHGS
jgi:molybdopterin-guanine dinucleotide biosynthesis protein A